MCARPAAFLYLLVSLREPKGFLFSLLTQNVLVWPNQKAPPTLWGPPRPKGGGLTGLRPCPRTFAMRRLTWHAGMRLRLRCAALVLVLLLGWRRLTPRVNDTVVLANKGFDPGAPPSQSEMITTTLICMSRYSRPHNLPYILPLLSYSPPLLLLLTTHLTTHHTSDSPPYSLMTTQPGFVISHEVRLPFHWCVKFRP